MTDQPPPPGYVVFDNNAYKHVTTKRLERIIAAERAQGIRPLASVAVVQELMARVRDADIRQRGRNRAAVRKLGEHCATTTDGRTVVNFLTHVEGQVYRLIAGDAHPIDERIFETYRDLVRVLSQSDVNQDLSEITTDLAAIEQLVARQEARYVERLKAVAQALAEPNEMKRNLNYAASIAARTQAFYGRPFSAEDIVGRVIDIAKITSIGFALWDSVLTETKSKGGGHAQHGNTLWDEQVVSSTSMYGSTQGKRVLLVTEEKRLLAAASSAGATDHVTDTTGYELLLGLSPMPT